MTRGSTADGTEEGTTHGTAGDGMTLGTTEDGTEGGMALIIADGMEDGTLTGMVTITDGIRDITILGTEVT